MVEVGGGGGAFQGIDPQLLAQLMSSLNRGVSNAQPLASSYLGQFSRLGVDTTSLNKLLSDYGWASGQQPMLQRRHDLASRQPSGSWVDGMATSGAGNLEWATPQAAQAAGSKAARQYLDGSITYQQYVALLEANEGDPDWGTGAAKTLGSDGLETLEYQLRDNANPDMAGWQALALAVAAGMANGVTYPYSDGFEDVPKGWQNLQLLDPLVTLAKFPVPVLVTLGNEVSFGGPDSSGTYADSILQAIAGDPQAAAEFMAQFPKAHGVSLGAYVAQGSDGYGYMPPDEAQEWANVITAGTVGAKNADPGLAAGNVTSLVSFYAHNSGSHTYGPIQAAYGSIVEGYWPAVVYAVTSATLAPQLGLGPDGLKLSPSDWAAFTDEAMRDPATTASVLNWAHGYAQALQTEGSNQVGAVTAGDAYSYQAGQVNGFFDYQAKTVYASMGSGGSTWVDALSEHVGDAVDMAFDIAADPGAAAKTVTVDISKSVIEACLTRLLEEIPDSRGSLPAPDYSQWQGTFTWQVNQNIKSGAKGNPTWAGLLASAKKFDKGCFIQGGQIVTQTPQQLKAYNAWLSSPGVINMMERGGQNSSFDDGVLAVDHGRIRGLMIYRGRVLGYGAGLAAVVMLAVACASGPSPAQAQQAASGTRTLVAREFWDVYNSLSSVTSPGSRGWLRVLFRLPGAACQPGGV